MNRNVRRSRKRVTGRFYLILAVVVLLAIGGVLIVRGIASWNDAQHAQEALNLQPQGETPSDGQTQAEGQTQGQEASQDGAGEAPSLEDILNQDSADGERSVALPDLKPEDEVRVAENELSITEGLPKEWVNFLLLGDDVRGTEKRGHTDTIIIASVNSTTGEVKFTSIMRDSMIEIPDRGMTRINNAYYYGGPNLMMKLINENLNMNIQSYVVVNFFDFAAVIDTLGGITLDIYPEEVTHINKNVRNAIRIMEEVGMGNVPNAEDLKLSESGADIHLNGMQTLAYARIRKLDNDYQRNLRQRKVLGAVLKRLLETSNDPIKLMTLAGQIMGNIDTNMAGQVAGLVSLGSTVLNNGVEGIVETHLPFDDTFVDERRNNVAALYDIDWGKNAAQLHEFIYGVAAAE